MRKNFTKGYSLIEIIISVSILTLIIGIFGMFQADVFSFNRIINNNISRQYEAKKIIRPVSNEIRTAIFSENGSYPLAEATSSSLIFYSNIDSDTETERVRYFLEDNSLKRGIAEYNTQTSDYDLGSEQITVLINNVSSQNIFTYYDLNNNETTTLRNIRLVKISLEINSNLKDVSPISLQTFVAFRNLYAFSK